MSPRPPPKISLRHDHDWTRGNDELGSTVEQQPVGKLVQQSFGEVQHVKFSKPTQPKPKPICDRSGKPEKLSENIRVKHAHDGTGQPLEQNSSSVHTVKEQHAPEEYRDIASFNADNEFNRAINEENIDFNIPGVPHSAVKQLHGASVRDLIQKIENHPQRHALQSDLQQHRQFNPFSKESQDVIKAAGITELCELLDMEPKAQCKVCLSYWDVGIVYCTCGHFLRDDTKENKKYIKLVLDLFPIPNYIRKGRPHGHRYGKKEGDHENSIANQLKKKCKKREFLSIHDRFIRDARFRKTMIEMGRTEEVIREMDKLANEDHTHHATEEKINVYRGNWWIRSNFVGSDTMPVRHRADFKEALSTLRRLKNQEDQAYYQNCWQSSSSSWWNWQDSWWHPSSETSPRLVQNYSNNSVAANAVYCHRRGGVKSIPPNTEKWLRKRYDENDDNNMSNETKRETNYSMNNK